MSQEIHYEIFRRQGAKGGWMLHEVVSGREPALEMAAALMAGEKATGVKVVKETYNDRNRRLSHAENLRRRPQPDED